MNIDDIHDVLRAEYRRRLLRALLECEEGEAVAIPDAVCNEEDDREDMYLELYHHHLPKLESKGLVECDFRQNEVVRGHQFEHMKETLTQVNLDLSNPRQCESDR